MSIGTDIAIRLEIPAHGGIENGQFPHGAGAAKRLEVSRRNGKSRLLGDAGAYRPRRNYFRRGIIPAPYSEWEPT
jgi:hypothetical protein